MYIAKLNSSGKLKDRMKKSFSIRFSIFSRSSGNDIDKGPFRKRRDWILFDDISL